MGWLRGRREFCLVLGYSGMAVFGVAGLLSGDELGVVYVVAAAAGLIFRKGQVLASAIWLGVFLQGLSLWVGGAAIGLLPAVAGLAGFVVSVLPPTVESAAARAKAPAVVSGGSDGLVATAGKDLVDTDATADEESVEVAAVVGAESPVPQETLETLAAPDLKANDELVPQLLPLEMEATEQAEPETAATIVPAPDPAAASPGTSNTHVLGAPSAVEASVRFRSIGVIDICADGTDLAPDLLRRGSLSFAWLYLFVRAVHAPGDRLHRAKLAEEVGPGLDPIPQRRLVTSQIYDLRHDLPPPLREAVVVNGPLIGLDLSRFEVDVFEMRRLEREVQASDGLISRELAAGIESFLDGQHPGEFLPGWEEIERPITHEQGTSGGLVRSVREQVDASRANLAGALAAHLFRSGRVRAAIPRLEAAYRWSNGRDDIADRLEAAHREAGDPGKAREFRARHRDGKEV